MKRGKRTYTKAQSILEYTIILSAVVLGILAMSGRMKESVMKQFENTAKAADRSTDTFQERMTVDAPPVTNTR